MNPFLIVVVISGISFIYTSIWGGSYVSIIGIPSLLILIISSIFGMKWSTEAQRRDGGLVFRSGVKKGILVPFWIAVFFVAFSIISLFMLYFIRQYIGNEVRPFVIASSCALIVSTLVAVSLRGRVFHSKN